jgi:hypothetical protein
MNQFKLYYIYTWKCHNETNKNVFLFFKIKKVKQILSGVVGEGYQWEGDGYKERVWEAEYDGNTMYTCMKMEK